MSGENSNVTQMQAGIQMNKCTYITEQTFKKETAKTGKKWLYLFFIMTLNDNQSNHKLQQNQLLKFKSAKSAKEQILLLYCD